MMNAARWLRGLVVIPFTLFICLYDLLMPAVQIPVAECLTGQIFGKITAGGMSTFLLTMDNLGFMVLFHVLFGNDISRFFAVGSPYYFSRISSRKKWTYKKTGKLSLLICAYTFVYLLLNLGIACRKSAMPADSEVLETLALLFVFIFMILLTSTCAINFLSILLGTPKSFTIVYAGIILMLILAATPETPAIVRILNPMSCIDVFHESGSGKGLMFGCQVLWLAAVLTAGSHYIERKDVLDADPGI